MLAEIENGDRYVICRHGKPVADLTAHQPSKRTEPHPLLKQITIAYDPTEELTAAEWGEID